MEIIIAENAGFCFGVERAIDATYETLKNNNSKVYSIGPIIHNDIVINDLESHGLVVINDYDEALKLKNEKVIIRTHGIEKNIYEALKNNGNEIIDLTCPFVSKIHKIVSEYSDKGYKIVVIGDKEHPEVKGIISYAKTDIYVIINENDIKSLQMDKNDNICVVCQTTTNMDNAQKLVDILRDLFYNIKLVNTICNATPNRQNEVQKISKECEMMLIIGSSSSSNTKKLYEIAKENCNNTYLLNGVQDVKKIKIGKESRIGVSAGASTPKYLIEEILNNVRNEF